MPFNKLIQIYFYIMLCTHSFIIPTTTTPEGIATPEEININLLVSKLSNFIPRPRKNTVKRSPTVAQISNMAGFFSATDISKILDNPIYNKTHPVQFRNILQEPVFSTCTKAHYQVNKQHQKGGWNFNFFFNRDDLKSYTESTEDNDPTKLSSYINLSDETILGEFERVKNFPGVLNYISNFSDFNVPDLFNLFAPMRLQEHKIGVMTHYQTIWNNLRVDVKLPFLWAERNFNFTEEEKEKIYTNELLVLLEQVDEWAFAKEYFISDQLGFGTLETTISADIIKAEKSGLKAGLTLYIPTEFAVKKGLLGTYRELQNEREQLDFASLLDAALNKAETEWIDKITAYFTNAFTQFTANLLHTPLGFDQHPGMAITLSPFWNINDRWALKSDYSMTLLMAIKQKRLILDRIHNDREVSELFAAAPNPEDKVKIIQIAINDRLFPYVSESLILPGAIFHSTSCLQYARKNNTYMAGYDSWLQLREQILSHSLDPRIQYNISAAEKPYAMQVKIFGKINKIFHTKSRDWNLSLYADYSLFNEALGNNFLINFEIQGTF